MTLIRIPAAFAFAALLLLGCADDTASSGTAMASTPGKACLAEIDMTSNGQRRTLSDCMENTGRDATSFASGCEDINTAGQSLVGADLGPDTEVHAAQMTHVASCPANAQGRCEGLGGRDVTNHYYGRPDSDLAAIETGCEMSGGRWVR